MPEGVQGVVKAAKRTRGSSKQRTPEELETPVTLSPIAASAAASEPLAVAVASLDVALGSPVVTVDVVTFSGELCSSARLHARMSAASVQAHGRVECGPAIELVFRLHRQEHPCLRTSPYFPRESITHEGAPTCCFENTQ